jgi:ArsR family transcriptional regulator, arsenate/arsenite/antimonite-responsive transcriptional repressor
MSRQANKTGGKGDLEKTSAVFRAFADENRLRIVNLLLSRAELCVCDIQRVLALPQARVSRHLTILKHAGIVSARRDGRWMHYALRKDGKNVITALKLCRSLFPDIEQLTIDSNSLDAALRLRCDSSSDN